MTFQQTYTFSDIGLKPTNLSHIKSRDDVDTSIDFLGYDISLPLIAAPMSSAVGLGLCKALGKIGGLACLPRQEIENLDAWEHHIYHRTDHIHSFAPKVLSNVYVAGPSVICIDTANGFNSNVGERIKSFKKEYPEIKIVSGNVASVEGYKYMAECEVDAVRVGIGCGSVCKSGIVTPIGVGQFSLIREIADYKEKNGGPLIIADGGIRGPRDIALAITAGADVTMAGKIFAACSESPGQVVKYNGQLYKPYAGQASKAIKKSDKYVEGDDTLIPLQGSLESVWSKISDGLRSAMAYMGCENIEKMKYLPDENFVVLSGQSQIERTVHA